ADVGKLEPICNLIAHHLKTDALTRPYDRLAGSMNFWRVAVPAPARGASVRCEVYTWESGLHSWAKGVPPALPPVLDEPWQVTHLLYAAGLPVLADAAVSEVDLHTRWSATMRDPPAEVASAAPLPAKWAQLVTEWKQLATRTFIDEVDGFPAMALGEPPSAAGLSPVPMLRLHPYRGSALSLTMFFPQLRASNNVALDGPPATNALGNVWREIRPNFHFDSQSLVVMIAGIKGGRGQRFGTQNLPLVPPHIAMSLDSGNYSMPVRAVAGRRAFTFDFFEAVPDSVSIDTWRTMAHELGHSFGLEDEYVDLPGPFTRPESDLDDSGNVTTDASVRLGGAISANAIKWNWLRARTAAFVGGPLAPAGAAFLVPVLRAAAFQFAVGDPVFLRKRAWREVINRAPVTSAPLQVAGLDPNGDFVIVSGALGVPPSTFDDGSVLYVPVPDPESAGLFLHLIAPPIAEFINNKNRSLGTWPCSIATEIELHSSTVASEFDEFDSSWSRRHVVRVIGLFNGGVRHGCGVYHPAGQCMMRASHMEANEFCHVCRFILAELIDARAHFDIDRDYSPAYPK
ncbi:MAG: M64 family metallopeptidase, partial [Gemmatimonadaceae bacterium]